MNKEKVTNLYILRHGQSKLNELKVLQGQKIFPKGTNGLTNKGKQQIEEAEKIIRNLGITRIFSSDLERCKETSEIINKNIKVPIFFVKELREQNCGDWEGKSSKEINIEKGDIEIVPPNGESLKDIELRLINFLDNVPKNNTILIITHGAVIQTLIGYYLNIPYDYRFRIKLNAGSISHVILRDNKPEIITLGFYPKIKKSRWQAINLFNKELI